MEKIIYSFWTGSNPMSINRKRCFDTMYKSNCIINLITPENLNEFIKQDYPLHESFQYLSLTHKSDYLRCYFMHHYGGGYSDIKEITKSWDQAFDDLFEDNNFYINGYPEISPTAVANVQGPLYLELQKNYKKLIGCGSFICKPNTPFTNDWMIQLNKTLDMYLHVLKHHPATHPQEKPGMIINNKISKYPIPWTDILGNIFHPLCLKYSSHIKQSVPPCLFTSYR
jgi:hypothetical protein